MTTKRRYIEVKNTETLFANFNVKKGNFRGLIDKIGHYWPILASRTRLWPILTVYAMGIVTLGMLMGVWNLES